MFSNILMVVAVLAVGGYMYYSLQPKSPKTATDVTGDQVAGLLNQPNVVMLDVRTDLEVSGGTIGNAKHINYMGSDFKQQIAQLDTSKTYVVYCHSGGRSPKAFKALKEAGLPNVLHYPGGWADWSRR